MNATHYLFEPLPQRMVSHFVTADGLRWHVTEMGQGPAIVLVHGTAASVHSWHSVMPLLAGTHRVIAMDLPGHAGTAARSAKDYTLERMADGISALVEKMQVTPEIVVGHSAGAAILVTACARKSFQAKSIVSFNGAFYPFSGFTGSLFSPIAKLIAANSFVPRMLANVASRATVSKLLRDTGSPLGEAGVEAYFRLLKQPEHIAAALGMMAAWDLSEIDFCFARLEQACLFVAGGKDKAVPPETAGRAAQACKHGNVLNCAEYGHLLHEENPVLAANIILGRTA
jgi:magnesium chelatase accessory protein